MDGIKLFFFMIIMMFVVMLFTNTIQLPDSIPVAEHKSVQLPFGNTRDRDGRDSQSEIVKSALAYVAKRPTYKSKYYATGYPDDNYGVCTDLVAFALRDVGYDLRELVNEDILSYPEYYDVEIPDKNIDFRRVNNLQVYFERHALSLTTDVSDVSQWQPGDIVVFVEHIGIISDKKNDNGVPYVIHHNDPLQIKYEEDILEQRNDITGHYRIR